LKRLWCLWGVLCTIDSGGVLELALSEHERNSFKQALLAGSLTDIAHANMRVDAQQVQCFKPEDFELLSRVLSRSERGLSGALRRVNVAVQVRLHEWQAAAGEAAICDATLTGDGAAATHNQARLLVLQANSAVADPASSSSKLAAAEAHFCAAAALRQSRHGADHADTLTSEHARAEVLVQRGKLHEAGYRLHDVLHRRQRLLGDEHADTLCSLHACAVFTHGEVSMEVLERKLHDARRSLEAVVRGRENELGEAHAQTLESKLALANLLSGAGDAARAKELYVEVVSQRLKALGEEHSDYLQALADFADFLGAHGELDEAVAYCREVLESRSVAPGEEHPSTLRATGALASLLHTRALKLNDEAELAEAEELCTRALDGYTSTLGAHDEKTAAAALRLAHVLKDTRKLAEAERRYRQALACVSLQNSDRIACISSLVSVLADLGKPSEAETLFQKLEAEYKQRTQVLAQAAAALSSSTSTMAEPRRPRALAGPWHFFLSHYQQNASLQVALLHAELAQRGYAAWLDVNEHPTEEGMLAGVAKSDVLILFLTRGALKRHWCQLELQEALKRNKPIVLLLETEEDLAAPRLLYRPPRDHAGYDGDATAVMCTAAPIGELIAELRDAEWVAPAVADRLSAVFKDNVAIRHRRQAHEREAMFAAILGQVKQHLRPPRRNDALVGAEE
jgi:hypothetical protein